MARGSQNGELILEMYPEGGWEQRVRINREDILGEGKPEEEGRNLPR